MRAASRTTGRRQLTSCFSLICPLANTMRAGLETQDVAITLNVNGKTHEVSADPETPLLYVLRNDLKLKGARYGCGLGQCGACTVIVDGRAVPSCDVPVSAASGKAITTIEGIARNGKLHPLQEAFIAEQAAQCGYCATGIIEDGPEELTGRTVFCLHPHQDTFIAPADQLAAVPADVPAKHKDTLPVVAGDLRKEAANLQEAAKAQDVKKSGDILQRIHLKIRELRLED